MKNHKYLILFSFVLLCLYFIRLYLIKGTNYEFEGELVIILFCNIGCYISILNNIKETQNSIKEETIKRINTMFNRLTRGITTVLWENGNKLGAEFERNYPKNGFLIDKSILEDICKYCKDKNICKELNNEYNRLYYKIEHILNNKNL